MMAIRAHFAMRLQIRRSTYKVGIGAYRTKFARPVTNVRPRFERGGWFSGSIRASLHGA